MCNLPFLTLPLQDRGSLATIWPGACTRITSSVLLLCRLGSTGITSAISLVVWVLACLQHGLDSEHCCPCTSGAFHSRCRSNFVFAAGVHPSSSPVPNRHEVILPGGSLSADLKMRCRFGAGWGGGKFRTVPWKAWFLPSAFRRSHRLS